MTVIKSRAEGAFRRLKDFAAQLQNTGIAKIPELNWTPRTPASPLTFETNTVDPYWIAEENWYYPFKTSRQFHRNSAFILIFAFSPRFNGLMSVNFGGSTSSGAFMAARS